jgi:glutathione synthase/RimK-type ligase-like ATP-grasp enzyme
MVAWDAAGPDGFDLLVLRSAWNYYEDPDAFLAWTARAPRLLNPAPVVAWNAHKRYLAELESAGIPVIPTAWVRRGATCDLAALRAERGWTDVVVKPAISAASYRTCRFAPGAGQDFLDALAGDRDAMVQRYLPSVARDGERALVWIDGALTHAVAKTARFHGEEELVSDALPVADDEAEFARRVLAHVDADRLLYARVDVIRDDDGALRLSELELIEPSLFLLQSASALARFVAAIAARA